MIQDYWRMVYHAVVHAFALVGLAFIFVLIGMELELFTVRGSIAERNAFFASPSTAATTCTAPCPLYDTSEWRTVLTGIQKDSAVIMRVSRETGVPATLIASVAIPEQLRFFTSEREVFKRVFEPLKILGVMSQFSLGISGIKPDAALDIERRTKAELRHLIAYAPADNQEAVRYERLTDARDHYYQWLYTALYIRIVTDEWTASGYPINSKPGVIGTLFNIGFARSEPKALPMLGGALITVGGATYTYGELTETAFHSPELSRLFAAQK